MTSRPFATAAFVGVGLEAAALVAAAVWMVGQIASGASQAVGTAVALVVFTLGLAAALVAVGLRLARTGSGPARATVVTWQLVQAGSAGMIIGADEASSTALAGAWFAAGLAVVVVVLAVLDAWRTNRAGESPQEREAARPS